MGKPFAVKPVQPHSSHRPESLARFRVEAQALGRLNHPNIVQVTDFGVDAKAGPYLVMEYIEGITLRAYLKHRRTLGLDEALPILSSVAHALDYAHDSGILHRDLKPANVLLFPREAGHYDAKILDFGIARFLDHQAWDSRGARFQPDPAVSEPMSRELTDPGTILGTLEYIAPETLRGEPASSSVDIYAFGTLIYEVLTGHCPFADAPIQELKSFHLHRTPPLPSVVCPSVPTELDQTILRALSKDPVSRPSRARDVVTGLREAYHLASLRRWRRRELPRRGGLSAAAAILVMLLYPLLLKLPVIQTLESQLHDIRVTLQPQRSPDPRIVLLSIDEATLSSDPRPLAEKADEVGTILGRVFDAGARAVAIDFLLPEQWSRSEPFSQFILDHSKNIVLASYSNPEGAVTGPESVRGLVTVALGRERVEALFGFANLSPDPDGVVRTMPLRYQDRQGRSAHSFAARTAQVLMARSSAFAPADTRVWVDYSVDLRKFRRISWKDAPHVLAAEPEAFRGRVILVGGEFAGSGDLYSTVPYAPALPSEVSGLVLQALTLNTLLQGRQMKNLGQTLLVAFLCVALAMVIMALLSLPVSGYTVGALAASSILYVVFSFLLFRWNRQLSPIVAPLVAFSLAIICAVLLRRTLPPFPRVAMEEKGI